MYSKRYKLEKSIVVVFQKNNILKPNGVWGEAPIRGGPELARGRGRSPLFHSLHELWMRGFRGAGAPRATQVNYSVKNAYIAREAGRIHVFDTEYNLS